MMHKYLLSLGVAAMVVGSTHAFVNTPYGSTKNALLSATTTKQGPLHLFHPDVDERSDVQGLSSSGSKIVDKSVKTGVDLSSSLTTHHDKEEQDDGGGEMTLFTARCILLLVAAIWGTNFAVRVICE